MRTIALMACVSLVCLSSLAQTTWLTVINGPGFVEAGSISIDPEDNVLAVGNFENSVTLGDVTYQGAGSFLIKLSKDGTHLWHRIVRYGAGDVRSLRKVDTDAGGNIYIAGNFMQSATVNGLSLSSGFTYAGYVAKFDPAGEMQWVRLLHNVQEFVDLKVNANGQILLYSMQSSMVMIDSFSFATGPNSFGAMLNSNGTLLWAKSLGESLRYTTWPRACAIDNAGNAYFHGIFSSALKLDDHEVTSTGGNHNFFVAKVNLQGTCQWLARVDRMVPAVFETGSPPNGLMVEPGALTVDTQGNVYLGGYSWNGIKVGSLSMPDEGTCLIKFNSTGQALWAKMGAATLSRGTIANIMVKDGLAYVSGARPGAYYFSVYTTDGVYTQTGGVTSFPAGFPGGLDVDSEHQVYLSGRIAYGAARLQGFVLKYGMPTHLPASAATVTGPKSICPSEAVLSFMTSAIDYATSYQWEIYNGATRFIVETTNPELHFRLSDYQIIDNFSIRVRGKSIVGTGSYSPEETIRVEKPATPTIVIKCGIISIENPQGISTLDWYLDNELAEEYGRTNTSITPGDYGTYHVTIDDVCGPAASNRLVFARETAPVIFVECGKIAIEEPESVVTADWYFNDALAEEYGRTNTSITPTKEGNYHAAIDAGCGPVKSTEVAYVAEDPREAPAIVASCREISVMEPATGAGAEWYFNGVLATQYGRTPSIKPTYEGTYQAAIDDVCGPIFSNEVVFEFLLEADFTVPNVITPNGDSYNQHFVIDDRLDSPSLLVYNRWGSVVYVSEQYTNTWAGDNLPSGVYYYELNSKCLPNAIKGVLSIAR